MLPNKLDSRWMDLVSGKINHQFKFTAAAMCVSRNQRAVKNNLSDPIKIQSSIDEVYTFFTKYEQFCQDDIKSIFK